LSVATHPYLTAKRSATQIKRLALLIAEDDGYLACIPGVSLKACARATQAVTEKFPEAKGFRQLQVFLLPARCLVGSVVSHRRSLTDSEMAAPLLASC